MKLACISIQHGCPVKSPKELRDIVRTARRTIRLTVRRVSAESSWLYRAP